LPLDAQLLPVRAQLLPLHARGGPQARRVQGDVARDPEAAALRPVGRPRVRPRALGRKSKTGGEGSPIRFSIFGFRFSAFAGTYFLIESGAGWTSGTKATSIRWRTTFRRGSPDLSAGVSAAKSLLSLASFDESALASAFATSFFAGAAAPPEATPAPSLRPNIRPSPNSASTGSPGAARTSLDAPGLFSSCWSRAICESVISRA